MPPPLHGELFFYLCIRVSSAHITTFYDTIGFFSVLQSSSMVHLTLFLLSLLVFLPVLLPEHLFPIGWIVLTEDLALGQTDWVKEHLFLVTKYLFLNNVDNSHNKKNT